MDYRPDYLPKTEAGLAFRPMQVCGDVEKVLNDYDRHQRDDAQDRERRLHTLRQALIDGERSGASTPFDFDEFVARKRTEGH